jgi:hypothetical protein
MADGCFADVIPHGFLQMTSPCSIVLTHIWHMQAMRINSIDDQVLFAPTVLTLFFPNCRVQALPSAVV